MLRRSPSTASAAEHRAGVLVGRHGLTRQGGLFDAQGGAFDQSQIGRNLGSGLEPDDVARDEIRSRNLHAGAVANHARARRRQRTQRRHGLLGTPLLRESQDGVQHDDGEDGGRLDRLADHRGDHRGHDQHADHEVGKLSREHREHADRRGLRQQVRTVALQPVGGLERGKTLMAG